MSADSPNKPADQRFAEHVVRPENLEQQAERIVPRLETRRLILRAPRLTDAEDVYARATAETFRDFLGFAEPKSSDDSRAHLKKLLELITVGHTINWQLEEKRSGRSIGDCSLQLREDRRTAEGAWGLHPEHQGVGYMTEAVYAITETAFRQLDVESIEAEAHINNEKSWRLMERLDMTRVRLEKDIPRSGDEKLVDVWRYRITRAEYEQLLKES